MNTYLFDDRRIDWQTLEGFEHLRYFILNIDTDANIADVLFKFAAGQQIVLHRHKAPNHIFVIQGEHRIYHADGTLKEIRPDGSYTLSPASDVPHREGGGDIDVILLFSIRGTGVLYDILDDDANVISSLAMSDFVALHQAQSGQTG
ncbi:regulator [Methylomonas sp. EFPC1]|uniref:cupin domain-containing protein n=1 Tax=Methylomonas sp. EFPC1 TaxID=2812647 RepID=UPI0019675E83|nr:regulator [Methylomonas sp. EFPC1]QSB02600.1 regulator [Methylomonas sp. EFPC1]